MLFLTSIIRICPKTYKGNDISATTIAVAPDGTIYVGGREGLYAVNLLNKLVDLKQPDYFWNYYSDFVYNEQLNQSFDLKNNLNEIVKNHKVILFSLNSLDYPQLASNMGKLLIQDLKEFASIKPRNQQINLVLDEFNVFASDSIINLINKTRSFNYQFYLHIDLKTDNKDLTDTIFGNTANIIAHNVKDPNSAEYLAKVFGTKSSQKITKQYDNKDKSSIKGSIREVEEYIVHPNDLKKLKVGQAYCKVLLPSSNQYVDKIDIQNYVSYSIQNYFVANKGIYERFINIYQKKLKII